MKGSVLSKPAPRLNLRWWARDTSTEIPRMGWSPPPPESAGEVKDSEEWLRREDGPSNTEASRISRKRVTDPNWLLDDLLNEAYSRDGCDLHTKDCHHRNISVTPITHR